MDMRWKIVFVHNFGCIVLTQILPTLLWGKSRKKDFMILYFNSLAVVFNVIYLNETWLIVDETANVLDNYDMYYTISSWKRNDSVVVYIKAELSGKCQQITLGDGTGTGEPC